ncbi:c-type heme family protein [Paraburkholderia caffeinilytica]|uniref:c-type heme family protein n=1 Tax=Paraburkholderia caffeinilytica TaxID=1761016 RepID=UPI0038B86762
MKLSLAIKFNLVFVAIFAIGLTAAGVVADKVLQQQALDETRHDADVLMRAAEAMQNYTAKHITPLLATQIQYSFVPESVPAFSAIEMLNTLQGAFPNFSYRSTMLNPTNPRDRPSDWETEVIARLHDQPALKEITGQRRTPGGAHLLFLARPSVIRDSTCMQCHSTPAAAPRTMLDKYGPANGFGWTMNEVIGAQFVSVPMSDSIAHGRALWRSFMEALSVVFAVVLIVLNVMVHFLVTRRLQALSRAADELSLGKLGDVELPTRGSDEIASLAVSFGRMRRSLVTAFELLDESGPATTVPPGSQS